MLRPERRTRADLVAAALISIVVVVAGVLIWWTSDARATHSRPAAEPIRESTPARTVPVTLTQLWTAPSPATTSPVVVAGAVITGGVREVHGRDPATGESRWSYARGTELCAVSWVYRYAVAVYPDSRGCGQVSAIDAATGRRGPARSSYADRHVSLTADDTTVLSAGATRLELWRSDLVRVLSYGEIDARVKPKAQGVGSGCTLLSAAASASAVSVLESCPGQGRTPDDPEHDTVRLALLRPAKEEDEPEVHYVPQPALDADAGARVLAVSSTGTGTNTAIYLPAPQPRVEVVDQTGSTIATTLLPHQATPDSARLTVSRPTGLISWWTGDAVLMFDADALTYRYMVTAADSATPLGPAATMADRLLIPIRGGVGVYRPETGSLERVIDVRRPAPVSTVFPRVSGTTLLEQRGDDLVALG